MSETPRPTQDVDEVLAQCYTDSAMQALVRLALHVSREIKALLSQAKMELLSNTFGRNLSPWKPITTPCC